MLPNLLVIGAQKAGTSSVHRYLDLHPEIAMSEPKELNFFTGPGTNWDRGVGWYESRFDARAAVRGESSPAYTAYPFATGVPERIRSVVPDVRLVYLVRDPVERMISEYVHSRSRGYERRAISDVFSRADFERSGYVAQSRYHMQLSRYLEHFPASQLLVTAQEDLLGDREATIAEVFRFLGVDDGFSSSEFGRVHNAAADFWLQRVVNRLSPRVHTAQRFERIPGARRLESLLSRDVERPALEPALRERVASYVADDAERLREATGRRFESWCV